jgi:hypothetical protein
MSSKPAEPAEREPGSGSDEPAESERGIRVSDAERQAVVDRLRRASGEGRITIPEFDERTKVAYAAATRADLEPLTADLPADPAAVPVATGPTAQAAPVAADGDGGGGVGWTVAVMSGNERRGRWRVARRTRAVAVMGGVTLDLREAVLAPGEMRITAVAVMGGVEIVVPEGVDVAISGFSLMGGYDARVPDRPRRPGAPLVQVRAFAIMGGVEVKSKPLRGGDGVGEGKELDHG